MGDILAKSATAWERLERRQGRSGEETGVGGSGSGSGFDTGADAGAGGAGTAGGAITLDLDFFVGAIEDVNPPKRRGRPKKLWSSKVVAEAARRAVALFREQQVTCDEEAGLFFCVSLRCHMSPPALFVVVVCGR